MDGMPDPSDLRQPDPNTLIESVTSESTVPPSLEETLKALLAPLQKQLTDLAADNKNVRAENSQLREELNNFLATPKAGNIAGDDFPPNPNAARSVVIATRPVMDDPNRYNHNKHVVDPGFLVRNDASPLSGKNRG